MRRGGDCYDGVLAGQLLFGRHSGYSDNNISFRIVLAN
jgi:hypothetical protein